MFRIKVIMSKLIWKVAAISPEWGNRVMDILGYNNYFKVMLYQCI